MDKELIAFFIVVVVIFGSMIGGAVYSDVKMAELGLQQCNVKTSVGYNTIWQKECQEPQGAANGSLQR